MSAHLIYITAKDKEEAVKIGRTLVQERLAACANITERVDSIYWWQDKIENDCEAVLITKTKSSLVDELIARVKVLHSYDCPCVVAMPIEKGNDEYLAWIERVTK